MSTAISRAFFSHSRQAVMHLHRQGGAAEPLLVEFLPAQFCSTAVPWQRARDEIVSLSRRVYQGKVIGDLPGYKLERVERELSPSDEGAIGLVSTGAELIGFASTRRLATPAGTTFHLNLTLVCPEFQRTRVSTYLQLTLGNAYLERYGLAGSLVSADTPNPVVVAMLTRMFADVYPNPAEPDLRPTEAQKAHGLAIASIMYPGVQFDADLFLVKEWYTANPGMIYLPEHVPQHRDQAVNAFCSRRLQSSAGWVNKQLIIGRLTAETVQRFLAHFPGQEEGK